MKFAIKNRETEGKNEIPVKADDAKRTINLNPFKKKEEEIPVNTDDGKKTISFNPFKKADDKENPSKKNKDKKEGFWERRKKNKLKKEIAKRTRNTVLSIVECSIVFLSLILGMKDVVASFLKKLRIMPYFADFLDSFSLNGIELGFRCFFIANLIFAIFCLILKPLRSFKTVFISIIYIAAFALVMYYFLFN